MLSNDLLVCVVFYMYISAKLVLVRDMHIPATTLSLVL